MLQTILLTLTICSSFYYYPADTFADEGQFPFEVSIAYKDRHICGGAIISSRAIVTAAHCIRYIEPSDLQVFAGVHNFLIFPRGHIYDVNSTLIHPEYDPATRDYDVGLVKLKNKLNLTTPSVDKISITSRSHRNYGGKLVNLIYWDIENGSSLLYTEIELWPQRNCHPKNIFDDIVLNIFDDKELSPSNPAVICAGIPAGLCIGDDAGSLTVHDKLWGIVSRNFVCDSKDRPLVIMNLSYVKKWIDANYLN